MEMEPEQGEQTPGTMKAIDELEQRLVGLEATLEVLLQQTRGVNEHVQSVAVRVADGNRQIGQWGQYLSDVAAWSRPLDERLAELNARMEESSRQLADLTTQLAQSLEYVQKLNLQESKSQEQLAALGNQLRRMGREQFRSNTLTESQGQRLSKAIELLQEALARMQNDEEVVRRIQEAASDASQRTAAAFIPVLDGLEAALSSGQSYLQRQSEPDTQRPGFSERLAIAVGRKQPDLARRVDATALSAWIDGLRLLRERVLATLEAEGIRPIADTGEPFDPYRHVAIGTTERTDLPNGIVIKVQRPGYVAGDRVIRYAEVVVNRLAAAEAAPKAQSVSLGAAEEKLQPELPGEPEATSEMEWLTPKRPPALTAADSAPEPEATALNAASSASEEQGQSAESNSAQPTSSGNGVEERKSEVDVWLARFYARHVTSDKKE